MEKWEYKVFEIDYSIDVDEETQFNELGEQGWELAGVVHDVRSELIASNSMTGYTPGETFTIEKYIFKRRKQ